MKNFDSKNELSTKENAKLILDFFHRTMMHHAMWFSEVRQRLGKDQAFEILQEAWDKSYSIQMGRMAKILGFEMEDQIPRPLLDLHPETLEKLRDGMAINWLANDGVWFQAVEFSKGMTDAKHCNDSCWGEFSPFEAWSIKRILKLEDQPGLDGLKKALKYRLYAFINEQSFDMETESSFVFRMDKCRVQTARQRKGLDDYPCKSGGIVEYTTFAEAIDSRIRTECISCPPDPHPAEYFCAWKFTLEE